MNCDVIRQQLPDAVMGTLTETETAAVRRHIRGCAACRQDAAELDEGLTLFGGAAHVAEPPPELKERVLSVLEEEWADGSSAMPSAKRPRFRFAVQALAAALVVLAGIGAWAGVAQSNANRWREDAAAYRRFLGALGGRDARAGTFKASAGVTLNGSVVMYDSDKGQSWVLVLARAAGDADPLTVKLQAPGGQEITVPFPIRFDTAGEGWTGMVTGADISSFRHVILVGANGQVVATADVQQEET